MVGRSLRPASSSRAVHAQLHRRFLLGVPARDVREGVSPTNTSEPPNLEEGSFEPLVHADERQVHLDTNRSFVIYPELTEEDKECRKAQLESLIVSTLRKWPKLGYFQGYHDILSVFLLTLQPELTSTDPSTVLRETRACVGRMSLHRIRDSMGVGLGPLVGQLRVLRRILRLADPDLASRLEYTSPLPYFALSNLLTLFSHDIPTLPLAQHVFDYLLARPPIFSIYLAASVVISHKQDALELETDGDDGMMHALFTQFPNLTDESQPVLSTRRVSADPMLPRLFEEGLLESATDTCTLESSAVHSAYPEDTFIEHEESNDDATLVAADSATSQPPFGPDSQGTSPTPGIPAERAGSGFLTGSLATSRNTRSKAHAISLSHLLRTTDELYEKFPPLHVSQESEGPSTALSSSSVSSVSGAHSESGTKQEENSPSSLRSSSPTQPTHVQHVRVDDIFGPNSVIFTWSEDPSLMLSDDDAEKLVEGGLEGVCNEYDGSSDRDLREGEYEQEKLIDRTAERITEEERHKRRKEMIRSGVGLSVAVLVGLSAVALYSAERSMLGGGSGRHPGGGHPNTLADWYETSSWVASFVVGLGERVLGL